MSVNLFNFLNPARFLNPAKPEASRGEVTGAIQQAAGTTGTSFEYLLATAKMESNFNPSAAATTSSAKGLFQFIEQTWLGTVKEAGAKLGYGDYADAITRSPSGAYSVSDPAARADILQLRNDPVASSAMAGVLTQSNGSKLTSEIGRRPADSELYMAHFMGVGGASKLIRNAENNPGAPAAGLFPAAADANRPIFYDRSGQARSVAEVYSVLTSRYAQAVNSPVTRTAMASAGTAPTADATGTAAVAAVPSNARYLSSFPDLRTAQVASFADGSTTAAAPASTSAQKNEPMFRSLFQAGERNEPISNAVQELWGKQGTASATVPGTNQLVRAPEVAAPKPLDLFSDRAGTFSG